MPYCTSDLWSGNGDGGLWTFRGRDVVKAVFGDLLANRGLKAGDEILFTGGSAGTSFAYHQAGLAFSSTSMPSLTCFRKIESGASTMLAGL